MVVSAGPAPVGTPSSGIRQGVLLSVVVPTFNEERRIAATLVSLCDMLRRHEWEWEVRVVDDGSSDATGSIVGFVAAAEPRVVLQLEPHRGKGGAVRAGLLAARGAWRLMCDADLATPVGEIDRFLPPALVDVDLAIGSRQGPEARRIGEPSYRHFCGRAFNLLVQQWILPGIEDSQCGFKMFSARAVDAILPHVTLDGWAFDLEVLAVARARGLRIAELPVEWHYRPESRVRLVRDGWGMCRDAWRVRARMRRGDYTRSRA